MKKTEQLPIRPYARLLTMLGDQLIKNERIALVELIKNSYDADADWVKIKFENFNNDMSANNNSSILIEDNGSGMTREDIEQSWMNPATPQKYSRKKKGERKTSDKKRIIQGEKGIGRFAILKLGKIIIIITRTENSNFESTLEYDFTRFDDNFIEEAGKEKDIFLDEIQIDYSEHTPPTVIKESKGTAIEIRSLKGIWNQGIIDRLCQDISNLTDPISRIIGRKTTNSFDVSIICNGKSQTIEDRSAEDIKTLIEDKSVLKIEGKFSSQRNSFIFTEDASKDKRIEVELNDPNIKALWIWRQRFGKNQNINREPWRYKCGSFRFHFYIFDFSRGIGGKHELNQKEKNMLKEHRIYLYRDDIRVYPYGDPDDDWLNIDITRGTGRAGDFFSNDQIIGWIDISHEDNRDLIDKTNREGLIETGNATRDFMFLIPTFLSYIKQHPYSRYEQNKRDKNVAEIIRSEVIANKLSDLKTHLGERGDNKGVHQVKKIDKEYRRERNHLIQRAEITEDLAGVGLSVEMTSHDIMLMMNRAKDIGKAIAKLSRSSGEETIQQQADMLVGVLLQITDGMQDIQSLFKSAKRRKKNLKIEPILDKISELHRRLLQKKEIDYEKKNIPSSPLVADTTDGVVMQTLINLFDNSVYWLDTISRKKKKIEVSVNGNKGELIFSDNGPGIDKEDLPYIFDPFYSGKGQEGRGLGLYIARQLLERHDYSISVIEREKDKLLSGANFVISFWKGDD